MNENERDYPIKNNAPVASVSTGKDNVSRNKSRDGRYTAATTYAPGDIIKHTDEYDLEQEKEPEDPIQFNTSMFSPSETERNEKVYEPTFVKFAEQVLVRLNKQMVNKETGERIIFQKANKNTDYHFGIDYKFGIVTKDNRVNHSSRLNLIDFKYVNGADYENPNITVNLWKKGPEDEEFIPDTFFNTNHVNTHYVYIIPNDMYNPTEAKTFYIAKERLEKYVNERILQSNFIQGMIQTYKEDNYKLLDEFAEKHPELLQKELRPGTYRLFYTTPNTNNKAEIYFLKRKNGSNRIVCFIPRNDDYWKEKAIRSVIKL